MAKSNSSADEGIRIEKHDYWTAYEGTRDDLIAGRICTADWFAELPKRVKCHFNDSAGPGGWSTKLIRGGRYKVVVRHPPRENNRYEIPKPQTEAQFREDALKVAMNCVWLVVNEVGLGEKKDDLSFKLSQDHYEEFIRIGRQLMFIIKQGKIIKGQAFIKQCRDSATAAETDAAFQRFMGKTAFPDSAAPGSP